MCRSLMGFLALSLGAALSAIFYLKYWIFVFQLNCLSLQFPWRNKREGKNSAQKTELKVVVPGSLAVTAAQGGLVPLLEPRAGVP